MKLPKMFCWIFALFCLWEPPIGQAAELSLELPALLERAVRENPDLKAKRLSLGVAQARAQQAGLFFQTNPRFSVEVESSTAGKSRTGVELNLVQELEIAGQHGHRYEAAAKSLTQAQVSVEDAERLLRLAVTQAFYNLLALQQAAADLKEVLNVQESLLQAGQKRFDREDISILELNTLRLDRDQVRSQLANKMSERLPLEKQLRLLAGIEEAGSLTLAGNLLDLLVKEKRDLPDRRTFHACVLSNRPDLKAAKLAVEAREAELRLAQARRVPNIALGPRYKRDSSANIVGAEFAIPLPFFNRNEEEIAAALANKNVSQAELEGRTRSVRQELDSSYETLVLAQQRLEAYGKPYLGDIEKMLGLTSKAYESGELSIFEFSIARDRFAQARSRSFDAALAYLLATAEIENLSPGCRS